MNSTRAGSAVCAVLIACALTAGPPDGKKAWEWTVEERMARRYDPSHAALRRATAVGDRRIDRENAAGVIVDGDRNPELLLPAELMDRLATAYYHPNPEINRKAEARAFTRLTEYLGEDARERLDAVLRPYLEAWSTSTRLELALKTANEEQRRSLEPQWVSANDAICPARAKALASARELFGRERFDRFLYEVVARGALILTDGEGRPGRLDLDRWVEEGCR